MHQVRLDWNSRVGKYSANYGVHLGSCKWQLQCCNQRENLNYKKKTLRALKKGLVPITNFSKNRQCGWNGA